MGEPHQEKWLHHCGHLPWPLQVHSGVPRVLQSFCDFWSLLLPDAPPAHEKGAHAGGLPGQAGPSCKTHTGNRENKHPNNRVYVKTYADDNLSLFQYKLTVPKVGYISDLCYSLSNLSGVPADKVTSIVSTGNTTQKYTYVYFLLYITCSGTS